jgi:aspartate/methionine/tyrosine aminotransferase
MWSVVSRLAPGTVRTNGAFYFLLRLPPGVTEEDAVRVLATRFRVLVTPGRWVGMPKLVSCM